MLPRLGGPHRDGEECRHCSTPGKREALSGSTFGWIGLTSRYTNCIGVANCCFCVLSYCR